MVICGTSNIGYQNDKIIEETLTANYIEKVSTRNEYLEKFKEYKIAYRTKWNKAKANGNEEKYKEDIQAFIDDMRPYNLQLKKDIISKIEYLKILNERKKVTIY